MIKNYIKIAWRNLRKHRFFSSINILGLALGVATFWIIALYVTDEWSFDRFHAKADRIFRVVQHGKWSNGGFDLAITSVPYAPALKADYPEVEEAIRIDMEGGGKIVYGDKQIMAPDMAVTDNAIFKIFTYHFLAGDPTTALSKPQSIVLTESLARKLFGDAASAMDKTILMDGNFPNKVTGVLRDPPKNSHFTFSGLRSFDAGYTGQWGAASIFTYVLLKNPADYKKIEAASEAFYNHHLKTDLANTRYRMELQPLTSIHLHSHLDYEMSANGNITNVYVFAVVALLIIGIAMINYVNLTTARFTVRTREIGIRKVIGSGRKHLLFMFFAESILLAILATAIGLVLTHLSLPLFNSIAAKQLDLWQFGVFPSLLLFAAFALVTGIVSGVYPALLLSGFRILPALKGQWAGQRSSTLSFRKSLVVFQFVITIVLIVASGIIYRQLHYVLNKDLGFNKSRMLTVHLQDRAARTKIAAIREQLLQSPLIENVAAAGNPIGNNDLGSRGFNLGPDGNAAPDTKLVQQLIVDEDFIPAMQIRVEKGRNFIKGSGDAKDNAIIVNETLVRELGWDNPIGMRVRTGVDNGRLLFSTIVGVIKDFNTYSLQYKITPTVLVLPASANDEDNLYIRLGQGNIPAALAYMQEVYSRFDAGNKLDPHFLDQNFANQYQQEEKQGTLILIFTVLAISIACLGLLGLVTFTAEQRVKEIGIRKVLGASVTNIFTMLTGQMVQWVLLSTLIASPIAWFAMHKWLQSFAYRVNIDAWIFLAAGALVVLIALLTVSLRSIQAALSNPVKSLRTE